MCEDVDALNLKTEYTISFSAVFTFKTKPATEVKSIYSTTFLLLKVCDNTCPAI